MATGLAEVLNGEPPDRRFDDIIRNEHSLRILQEIAPLARMAVQESYDHLQHLGLAQGSLMLRGYNEEFVRLLTPN